MVYCRLINKDNNILTYAIGNTSNDVTGELTINAQDLSFDIIKQPSEFEVYPLSIYKMLIKYENELKNGNAPETMSYDI